MARQAREKHNGGAVLVGVHKVAQVFELTARRVQQLIPEGLPHPEHGKYDLAQCMVWFIRYQNKRLAANLPEGPGKNIRAEKERGLRLDAELKELSLAQRRKQLVSIADVEKDLSDLVLTTRARLMSVPPRLAGELVGVTSRVMIQALAEKSLVDALTQLAKGPDAASLDGTKL